MEVKAWHCPICGCPIEVAYQPKVEGGHVVMLTCTNKACQACGCTTSDNSINNGHFYKIWGFVPLYNPLTGEAIKV